MGIPSAPSSGSEGLASRERRAVAVEGAKVHPPPLVEAEGPGVVVGGDEPQAAAPGGYGPVAGGVHQGPADPQAPLRAEHGHHLAFAAGRVVGEQADGPTAFVGRHEAREGGGVHEDALAGDADAPEGLPQPMGHPQPVGALYGADPNHRKRMIPFSPRWVGA